jgi:hypothetical protein
MDALKASSASKYGLELRRSIRSLGAEKLPLMACSRLGCAAREPHDVRSIPFVRLPSTIVLRIKSMGKRTTARIRLSFHAFSGLFPKMAVGRCDRIGDNRVAHHPLAAASCA